MKKLILLAVIFSFQNVFAQSYNGWFFVNPKPQAANIISCDFLDANTGYAYTSANTILKTTNAGINWSFHSYVIFQYARKFYAQNENTFYIIGLNGKVAKSTNAGITFFDQTTPIAAELNCVQFINNSTGFIGSVQYFLRTTNGGNNWTNVFTPFFGNFYDILFLDEQTGFAAANGGRIMKTTNSGQNWVTIQTPAPNNLYSITFLNQNTGFACGSLGSIIRTTNGGNNWTNITSPFNADYKAIHFLNATSGFILCYKDNENHLIRTTNGGAIWEYDDFWSFGPFEMRTSALLQTNQAILLGDFGQMYKSANLNAWSRISTFAYDYDFNDLKFFNENTGYAVDDTARMFKTFNSGDSWDEVSQIAGLSYTRMSFINNNTGFIFGMNMPNNYLYDLYRTSNAGLNWTKINFSTAKQYITDIIFPNLTTGYLGGAEGFYKSTNSGLNWSLISKQIVFIEKMQFVNVNTGYYLDWYGNSFLRTSNGGLNWVNIKSVADTSQGRLADFDAYNENSLVITVSHSSGLKYLLKTTNNGNTWDSIAINSNIPGSKVKFLNANKGFILSGNLFTTTNGGLNWFSNPFINAAYQTSFDYSYFQGMDFIDGNTGFIYGGIGLLAKTTTGGSVFINNEFENIPITHILYQNYPNPFNPSTTISFYLKKSGIVKLNVYDISGRLVAGLVNEFRNSGFNEIRFHPENLSSGIYFYSIETDGFKESRKMVLIK